MSGTISLYRKRGWSYAGASIPCALEDSSVLAELTALGFTMDGALNANIFK